MTFRQRLASLLFDIIESERQQLEAIQVHSPDVIAEAYEKGRISAFIEIRAATRAHPVAPTNRPMGVV